MAARATPTKVTRDAVEARMHQIFVDAPGTALRREELKKTREVTAMLGELARVGRGEALVDVAAGKSYLGLLAVAMLGFERLVVIERDAARLDQCRRALGRLEVSAEVSLRQGDVGDLSLWPERPGAVVALHACGPASDAALDAAVAREAKWLLLVPCCYSPQVPAWPLAERRADALGLPSHAEVRRRFVHAFVDAERTLRLEAAGWETTAVPFVAPTVTPHNLLLRARRAMEPGRMRDAAARHARLTAPDGG